MQQLSFLEIPPPSDGVPVWTTLDEEQRAIVVKKLARLMVNTITPIRGEQRDERAEQDHP